MIYKYSTAICEIDPLIFGEFPISDFPTLYHCCLHQTSHNSQPRSSVPSLTKHLRVSGRSKKSQLTVTMRKHIQSLRIHTDQKPTSSEFSLNRTPPLDPPQAMASPLPSRAQSRSSTPSSNRASTDNNSPKRGFFARIAHELKEDFHAGSDPKGFQEKRRSAISRSNSRATSPMPPPSPGSNQPGSRGPSRAATSRSVTSHPAALNRSASQKAKHQREHEKEVRKLQREISTREKVKNQRDIERGGFTSSDGTGSPRHAPLYLLEEANNARHLANEIEQRRLKHQRERRLSDEERRRAYAPAGTENAHKLSEPHPVRPSSRRRQPEYDKPPHEPRIAQWIREIETPTQEEIAPASRHIDKDTKLPPIFTDPFKASADSASNEYVEYDINPYHWEGLQPQTPPKTRSATSSILSKYMTQTEEEEDPFSAPARQQWTTPPTPESEQPEQPIYWQKEPVQPRERDYNPYEFEFSQQAPTPPPAKRGELETIVNRITMPNQDSSRAERDTYQTHVTRRRGDPVVREFF